MEAASVLIVDACFSAAAIIVFDWALASLSRVSALLLADFSVLAAANDAASIIFSADICASSIPLSLASSRS